MSTTTKRPDSDANAAGAAHHERRENMVDETQPTRLALRLTIDLDEMSWGDLRAFVRMADLSGIPNEAPVEVEVSDNYDPIGLATHIDPRTLNGGR